MTMEQFRLWLTAEAKTNTETNNELAQKAEARGRKFKPIELAVNIRAEEGIHYDHVYKVRDLCNQVGIKTVTISVKTRNPD